MVPWLSTSNAANARIMACFRAEQPTVLDSLHGGGVLALKTINLFARPINQQHGRYGKDVITAQQIGIRIGR